MVTVGRRAIRACDLQDLDNLPPKLRDVAPKITPFIRGLDLNEKRRSGARILPLWPETRSKSLPPQASTFRRDVQY